MRKKIERLTPEQTAKFPQYVAEWKGYGLSTAPADRQRAEAAIRLMYSGAGLPEPRIVWTQSPLGNALAFALTSKIFESKKVGASVRESVWASVWASVRESVGESVGASVRESVGESVWESVGASVRESVGESVGESVRESVWESVWASVRESVRESVWESVWASVRESVGESVWESVWASVRESVGESVGASVGESVRESVWESVWASVRESVWESVWASVWESVRESVWASVGESVRESVWESVWASVRESVGESVGASVWASVWASVRESVWASVGASVRESVWESVWASVRESVRESVGESVGASVRESVGESVWESVGESVWESVWASVRESVWESVWASVRESVYGAHDASWLAFYKFFHTECGLVEETQKLAALWELCQSAGWALPYEKVYFVSERHSECHLNEAGRIHCETGPAIRYPDGFEIFGWHGFRIPQSHSWIIADKAKLTPDAIDQEDNAELRRIMLEIFGFERYIEVRGAKEIACDEVFGRPRRLLSMRVRGEEIRVLDVWNGSLEPDGTRRRFFLGAMRGANTPHEAVAMSYGISPDVYSEGCRT